MDTLQQFLQDPAAIVMLLGAGATGAVLVLVVALLLLTRREREIRALRVDHSLERDRRARLEAEKEALDERLGETQRERDERGQERDRLRAELEDTRNRVTELTSTLQHGEALRAQLENAEQRLKESFTALSGRALESNREQLLADLKRENTNAQQAVDGLVKPIGETLQDLHKAQASLNTRLGDLSSTSSGLQDETRRLANALRRPEQRGRWGELQLQRCVELAGMQRYVDYMEQESVPGGGRRPDMVVRLPNERRIVVDAKTPMDAYISAWETQDEEARNDLLQQHAEQVRSNLDSLARQNYQEYFPQSPDFVVMFLPGEVFYSAALQQQPALIEYGIRSKVLIATPTILVALLSAVHKGWGEFELAREAEEIGRQGQELYKRSNTLVKHVAGIRDGIDKSVRAYNEAIGSLNSRFIPQVERFRNLQSISGEELPELEPLSAELRHPRKHVMKSGQDGSEDQ